MIVHLVCAELFRRAGERREITAEETEVFRCDDCGKTFLAQEVVVS